MNNSILSLHSQFNVFNVPTVLLLIVIDVWLKNNLWEIKKLFNVKAKKWLNDIHWINFKYNLIGPGEVGKGSWKDREVGKFLDG